MLRSIVVDDEELAVKRFNKILTETRDIEVCGAFLNPADAINFIKSNKIDIAFIDISMPEIGGLELAKRLKTEDLSINIVFTTAYEEYAVKAFDLDALDYLLKPIVQERLQKTIEKACKLRNNTSDYKKLKIKLFNGFYAGLSTDEAQRLNLRSPKTEELFTYLLLRGSTSREAVIDILWNGFDPKKAMNNLNSTLYYIRKALLQLGMEQCLITGKSEIKIDKSFITCDLFEFEALVHDFKHMKVFKPEMVRKAEALYTGALLKDKGYEWATEGVRLIENDFLSIIESAANYYMKENKTLLCLHYYNLIIAFDPLREDIHYRIILIYIQLGRKNEALNQFRQLEKLLWDELGTYPDEKIKNLLL